MCLSVASARWCGLRLWRHLGGREVTSLLLSPSGSPLFSTHTHTRTHTHTHAHTRTHTYVPLWFLSLPLSLRSSRSPPAAMSDYAGPTATPNATPMSDSTPLDVPVPVVVPQPVSGACSPMGTGGRRGGAEKRPRRGRAAAEKTDSASRFLSPQRHSVLCGAAESSRGIRAKGERGREVKREKREREREGERGRGPIARSIALVLLLCGALRPRREPMRSSRASFICVCVCVCMCVCERAARAYTRQVTQCLLPS